MSKKWFTYSLIGMIVAGMLVSFYLGYIRHGVEQANKQVELALDWIGVRNLAGLESHLNKEQVSEREVLESFQSKATGVLFKELTLNDYKLNGEILFAEPGFKLLGQMEMDRWSGLKSLEQPDEEIPVNLNWNYIVFKNMDTMNMVRTHFEVKANQLEEIVAYTLTKSDGTKYPVLGTTIGSNLSKTSLNSIGLGFDEVGLALASKLGFNIIPQIKTWPGFDAEDLEFVFGQFEDLEVSTVLFNDGEVPGFGEPGGLVSVSKKIAELEVPVGIVEFFPQKGLDKIIKSEHVKKNAVRLHSISEGEMRIYTKERAIERFNLATTDRDMRVLFVRLIPDKGLESNVDYINDLRASLEGEGFKFGKAETFDSLPFSRIFVLIIALGITAGGVLLLSHLGYDKPGIVLGSLGFLGFAGLLFIGQVSLARKALAMISVIIFPTLSISLHLKRKGSSIGESIYLLIKTTLVSLIGAVFMVGLLADKSFMLKIDQFMGVKLAHLIPVVLILGIFWFIKDDSGKPFKKIAKLLDYPITVKYVALLGVLGVIMLIYISRTGNEGAAVSGLELAMRRNLETLLSVRPRTKEFLIGHPLMMLMFCLGYRDKYLPILLVASIGQISLVNTFAHIHTPVIFSIIRTFNGLWLGIIFGVLLIGAYVVGKKLVDSLRLTVDSEKA